MTSRQVGQREVHAELGRPMGDRSVGAVDLQAVLGYVAAFTIVFAAEYLLYMVQNIIFGDLSDFLRGLGRRLRRGESRGRAASACHRPTIWRPTGKPSFVKPQGTVAAGCPVRLNGYVKGSRWNIVGVGRPPISTGPCCGTGPGSAAQAPTGICGVSSRSHVSKNRRACS